MGSHDPSESADGPRGRRPGAVDPPHPDYAFPVSRPARSILVATLLGYALLSAMGVLSTGSSTTAKAAGLLLLVLVVLLQLHHSRPGMSRVPLTRRCLTLTLQALLTYLPVLVFQTYWETMAGYLAGSLLLLLPPRVAWPLYATVGLSMLVPPLLDSRTLIESIPFAHITLLSGLVLYGLTRLTELTTHVHSTRGELARRAVTGERLRFARDLHDLLGFSLSAITLKSELIQRLIPTQPNRAMKEISEVLTIAGQSLADVRKAASGYRTMSLQQEIRTAQTMLDAAGIGVRVHVELGTLSPHVETELATTLREAVTNLLRHSEATHCVIRAVQQDGVVRLVVENDGADSAYHNTAPHSGNGLRNLHARMTAIGGHLESGPGEDGMFRLLAEAPLRRASESATEPRVSKFPPNGTVA
ncbi:sensor histidine kinase [Streptomyces niveus]|uniref:sensor histidine kinase n=1 Tax=Streptomyces niveus TaxID=193462 RepID=UPI0009A07911|nr:histidine kinase [Streptomyces niveus]